MIAYLCNCCKNPIITSEPYCAHLEVRWGENALKSKGQYGSGYSVDLCEDCYKKLGKLIDDDYFGGNKYLQGKEAKNG